MCVLFLRRRCWGWWCRPSPRSLNL